MEHLSSHLLSSSPVPDGREGLVAEEQLWRCENTPEEYLKGSSEYIWDQGVSQPSSAFSDAV